MVDNRIMNQDLFFQRISDIYSTLLSNPDQPSGQVKKSLSIIEKVSHIDIVDDKTGIRDKWMQILLDIFCIIILCKTDASEKMLRVLPNIENADFLAPQPQRDSNLLLEDEERYNDWHFANRVRAWHRTKGVPPILDMKDHPTYNGCSEKVCDFHFKIDGQDYLIECKRISSNSSYTNLKRKIRKRVSVATKQFFETENWMKIKAKKYLIMDVTNFGRRFQFSLNNSSGLKYVGWQESSEDRNCDSIIQLATEMDRIDDRIDDILLCWDQVCYVDDKPISIVQRVISVRGSTHNKIYQGWTLIDCIWDEGISLSLPNKHNISIHSIPRAFPWIEYEYRQISDNASFIGKGTYNPPETK